MKHRTLNTEPRTPNADMAHLLPVERLISHEERERDRRSRTLVLVVFGVTGWVFFVISLAISGCR